MPHDSRASLTAWMANERVGAQGPLNTMRGPTIGAMTPGPISHSKERDLLTPSCTVSQEIKTAMDCCVPGQCADLPLAWEFYPA